MIIILISSLALIVFLFSMDFSWSNVLSSERNDLVFEGRHQEYGAYQLRREHHKTLMLALLLSTGLVGGGMALAGTLMKSDKVNLIQPKNDLASILVDLREEKPIEKPKPAENERQHVEPSTPASSGNTQVNEVEIVNTSDAQKIQSDLDLLNKPAGKGDDEPGEPIAPSFESGSGGTGTQDDKSEKSEVKIFVKNKPEFPGGDEALMKYMLSKVRFSEMDIDQHVEGTIYLNFIVDSDGKVRDVAIVRNIPNGHRMGKLAIEAIEAMPRWKPGDDGAEPLPVLMTLPLKIELRN
ncbi:MAG: energy transducer TonB [Flavobacteriales bacterium]|nr:energy transducer TonB [Flavobacteriales bacterium]